MKQKSEASLISRRWLLLSLIAILMLSGFLLPGYLKSKDHESSHWLTPSVTTFGYNATRTARVTSHINSSIPFSVQPATPDLSSLTSGASKHMPLYINGHDSSDRVIRDRRVLIAPDKSRLRAIDVDKASVLWEVKVLENHVIAATPVIDLDAGKIYFYSVEYQEATGFDHEIYQVDLDGENFRNQHLNFDRVFKERGSQTNTVVLGKHLHCKTAMGLNKNVSSPFVYLACSIQTGKDVESRYGAQRGLSGLVVGFLLDQSGNMKGPDDYKAFFTSATQANPATGFDTGIYNSGSGPSTLPDGSLLVATGNGPVFLESGNFGCSMVRLGGTNLQPMINSQGRPSAFSHAVPPYNECWYLNVEYSSSSTAVLNDEGVLTAAVISKDGFLDVFNPLKMDSSRAAVTRIKVANGKTHSQPAIVKNINGARVISLVKSRPYAQEINDLLLTDGNTLTSLTNVTQTACYGWVSSIQTGNSPALSLLYSGPMREDYVMATTGSEFYHELISFFSRRLGSMNNSWISDGLWGPYFETSKLGYSIDPQRSYGVSDSSPEHIDLEEYFDAGKNMDLNYAHPEFWVLRNLDEDRDCRLPDHPGLTALYAVKRHAVLYSGRNDSIDAHDFNYGDGSIRRAWSYELGSSDHLMRTHPVISTDAKGRHPIVVALVYSDSTDNGVESSALFISGKSGELINRVNFQGHADFSMPLIFDEKLVIPTVGNGLQIFNISKSTGSDHG